MSEQVAWGNMSLKCVLLFFIGGRLIPGMFSFQNVLGKCDSRGRYVTTGWLFSMPWQNGIDVSFLFNSYSSL